MSKQRIPAKISIITGKIKHLTDVILSDQIHSRLRSFVNYRFYSFSDYLGGGSMVLGKLPGPGRPTIWMTVGQGPTALAVGAGGGLLDIFTLLYLFFYYFSFSLGDGPI